MILPHLDEFDEKSSLCSEDKKNSLLFFYYHHPIHSKAFIYPSQPFIFLPFYSYLSWGKSAMVQDKKSACW
jgi:hypothetical protein